MARPILTWLVQDEDNSFNVYKSYTEPGSLQPGDVLEKNIRIYNGYGGQVVENSYNTKLIIAFKDYESNFLLNLFEVKVNDGEFEKLEIDIDRGSVNLGTIYKNEYVDVKIKIGPIPENINNGLKSVIFYLENDKF